MKEFNIVDRQAPSLPNPLESHTADSKWQFCNCESCQRKRILVRAQPGGDKIDFATHRRKDEKY